MPFGRIVKVINELFNATKVLFHHDLGLGDVKGGRGSGNGSLANVILMNGDDE